jgi:hypothetical protein
MNRPPLFEQLDQDETWTDSSGTTWRLEDMEPSHRQNLLAWFHRNAARLQAEDESAWLGGSLPSVGTVAFDMVMGDVMSGLGMTAQEWLEEQPLIERLRELEADAEAGAR